MKILDDGSLEGQTFSGDKYTFPIPVPRYGQETYRQYRERVNIEKEKGFHLGDLGNDSWTCYCMGSGVYEGADADAIIN